MITKAQLLDACRHETKIIKHLATLLPEGALEWRPTPGQRTTLELMRYMSVMSEMMAINSTTGDWEHAPALNEQSASVNGDNFAAAMDHQMQHVAEVLESIDETAASTTEMTLPWREPIAQSALLMRGVYAGLVGYRMQLFLYAKQSGNSDISTMECWAGMSPAG